MRDSWFNGRETVVSHVDIVAGSSAPSDRNYTRLSSGCKGRLGLHSMLTMGILQFYDTSCLSVNKGWAWRQKLFFQPTILCKQSSRARTAIASNFVGVTSAVLWFSSCTRARQWLPVFVTEIQIFIESVTGSARVILAHTVHPFGLAYIITYVSIVDSWFFLRSFAFHSTYFGCPRPNVHGLSSLRWRFSLTEWTEHYGCESCFLRNARRQN